jgi:hypothetical protein
MGKKKSLTETAKAILMNEGSVVGGYPSVTPDQLGSFDRDAKTLTPAKASLRPGAGYGDKMFANPDSNSPDPEGSYEDLGPALVNNTDIPPSAKASGKLKKDTSRSGQSAVPPQPMAEEMDEDVELSEELEDFINECIAQGLNEEEIQEAIEENFEFVTEDADEIEESSHTAADNAEKRKEMMKEHVDALLEGEELSEDFRSKAETIFESAVSTRLNEEVAVLEEAYAQSLEEEVDTIREQLTEQVNDYLNYVVEQWVSENEVAIESGLRAELTEDFISGLRNLFTEHYMDIPEEKVDVLEGLGVKVEELEAKLNEEFERNVSLTKVINESKQFEVLVNACDGLTTTQTEKLKALAENVSFTTPEEFETKILTLRESYFPQTIKAENVLDADSASDQGFLTEETTGRMGAYVKALGKTKLK